MNVEHQNQLITRCKRLFNEPATSDVTVVLANGQEVYCHRIILAAWSSLWAVELNNEQDLFLKGSNPAIAFQCLEYIYSGQLELTHANLIQVHTFAQKNQLFELQNHCEQTMTSQLSTSNCMALFDYYLNNDVPTMPNALEATRTLACTHFAEACQAPDFVNISTKALCEILQDARMTAAEDAVLSACMCWLAAKWELPDDEMATTSHQVLSLVRFSQLSPKALLEVKSWELIHHYAHFNSRYVQALEWAVTRQVLPTDQKQLQCMLRERYPVNDFAKRGLNKFTV